MKEELRSLAPANSETVSKHLVMAARLIDEDPALAYEHAKAAQRTAARVASVREACGLTAYAAGHYAEALAELRAARRMSGSQEHLPVMADCERGLGRPERALAVASSDEAKQLDAAGQVELRIVASGARRDLGQLEAAVVTLQVRDFSETRVRPWTARLRYAYADALLAAGRSEEALDWFRLAADADSDRETDAVERVAELEGVSFVDVLDEDTTAFEATVVVGRPAGGTRAADLSPLTASPVDAPGQGTSASSAAPVDTPAEGTSEAAGSPEDASAPVTASADLPPAADEETAQAPEPVQPTRAPFAAPSPADSLPAAPASAVESDDAHDGGEGQTLPRRPTYGAGLFQEPIELADAPDAGSDDEPPA